MTLHLVRVGTENWVDPNKLDFVTVLTQRHTADQEHPDIYTESYVIVVVMNGWNATLAFNDRDKVDSALRQLGLEPAPREEIT